MHDQALHHSAAVPRLPARLPWRRRSCSNSVASAMLLRRYVALDENQIIVGDDEKAFLSIYQLDNQSLEVRDSSIGCCCGEVVASRRRISKAATIFRGTASFGSPRMGREQGR